MQPHYADKESEKLEVGRFCWLPRMWYLIAFIHLLSKNIAKILSMTLSLCLSLSCQCSQLTHYSSLYTYTMFSEFLVSLSLTSLYDRSKTSSSFRQYFICGVWHDPGMICEPLEVIQIFGAWRADEGVPSGPKKSSLAVASWRIRRGV